MAAQLLATDPGEREWVVEALRDAAGRALALGDPEVAVTYLSRALAESPPDGVRARILADLGGAEALTGAAGAIPHLEQAIELSTDPRDHARAALELAGLLKFAGDSVRAVKVLEAAAAALGETDPELAERLQVELIGTAYISVSARRMLAERIAALEDPGGPPRTFLERFKLAAMCFDAFAEGRPAEEVARLATRALAGGDLPTDPVNGGHAFVSAAIGLQFAEHYEEADRLYTGALEDARRMGSGVSFAAASSLRSLVNYRRGRLSEAEADARAALDLAGDVHGSQGFLSAALGTLVYTSLDRGTVDADLERLAERFLVEQATDNLPYTHALHSRACLLVERGELRRGLEELLAAGRRELEWGAVNPAITPWRSSAALVHAALGEQERGDGAGRRGGRAGAGVRRAPLPGCRAAGAGRGAGRPDGPGHAHRGRRGAGALGGEARAGPRAGGPGRRHPRGRRPRGGAGGRWAAASSWPPSAGPRRWPNGPATSCWPRARGRAGQRSRAWAR